jgi:hypothetical protein
MSCISRSLSFLNPPFSRRLSLKDFCLNKNPGQYGNFAQSESWEQKWGELAPHVKDFLKKICAHQDVHTSHSADNSSSFKDFVYKSYSPAPVAVQQQPLVKSVVKSVSSNVTLSTPKNKPYSTMQILSSNENYLKISSEKRTKYSNCKTQNQNKIQTQILQQYMPKFSSLIALGNGPQESSNSLKDGQGAFLPNQSNGPQQKKQEGGGLSGFFSYATNKINAMLNKNPETSPEQMELSDINSFQINTEKQLQELQKNNKIASGNYVYQFNDPYQQFSSSKK